MKYSERTFSTQDTPSNSLHSISTLDSDYTKRPTQEDIRRAQQRAISRNSGNC